MRHSTLTAATLALALGLALLPACDEDSASEPEIAEIGVSCAGKCDGWSSIKSLWADAKKLDLGDLLSVGAKYATEGLNDALDFTDFASIALGAPQLYALSDVAKDDLTLNDIDALVSGLAREFGDNELTTEVNRVRRDHLMGGRDAVFAESKFRITGDLGHGWNLDTGDVGANVTLGFEGTSALEARVIGAYPSELDATGGVPLRALRATRGFILPRSLDDIRDMKPGESFALSGDGTLGLNLGVGVPLLIAQPIAAVSYSFVVSAGLRTRLSGGLDVQLVRLDGDRVVVDVGMDATRIVSAALALEDRWGVQGLVRSDVSVGPVDVDLGKLLDKTLRKVLDKKLSLVSARAARTNSKTRTSVARIRFALDGAGDRAATEAALAQALRADVRLAQALSHQGDPNVTVEFDLSRSGVSTTSHAGIDILGMSFFKTVADGSGEVDIATPGGARKLIFESLHKSSGWFFSSHGYTRTGLAGLIFETGAAPRGEVNLFLEVLEGDDFMERDKLLDHLDGVLMSVAGGDAFTAMEIHGNALQRYVQSTCRDSGPGSACRVDVLTDPTALALRADAEAAFLNALFRQTPEQTSFLTSVLQARLVAQATFEPGAAFVGPESSVVLDYRLDDGALAGIFDRGGEDLRLAINGWLTVDEIDRGDDDDDIADDRDDAIADAKDDVDAMVRAFAEYGEQYQRMQAAEGAFLDQLGAAGGRALEVRFETDDRGRIDYDKAAARTLPEARAEVASRAIDALIDLADALDPHAEQTVAYALLALTPLDRVDLRLDVDMDLSDGFSQGFAHYREAGYAAFDITTKGGAVDAITGGMFNIDALIDVD